ncbi:hypothetical protein BHE17_11955 [Planococcus maritimus]|uniref:hypothetical protein n=1 Tax=Planococcus maritimus TaxID=192421 RepID=UPI00084CBFE7|nr:hypothetical protein [Planococcus maritimus]OED33126.1 hypothetical protein BHE17_11955 [Planococcus maritimus]
MLIIMLLLFLLIFISIKISRKIPNYFLFVIILLVFQLGWLTLYRIELYSIGRDVYYSDASAYWNATKSFLLGYDFHSWNMGYVYYSAAIQKFSFFVSVLWNNISNLLLLFLSIVIFSYIMLKEGISSLNIKIFTYSLLLNPLVSYGLYRNLKDSLFLFLTVLSILVVYSFAKNSNKLNKIINIIFIAVLMGLLPLVRPWGFVIPPLLFLITLIYTKKISAKKILNISLVLLIAIFSIVVSGYREILMTWIPYVLNSADALNPLRLILSPLNLVIGPGPIRPLFPDDYFEYYTIVGNISTSLGALMWWLILPFFIVKIRKIKLSLLHRQFGIVLFLFIIIYSLAYGGSVEIRFRSVLYILITAQAVVMFNMNLIKKDIIKYIFVLSVIVSGGLYFGI